MDVVTYYTPEGRYKQFAETLRASCERFGIAFHGEEVPTSKHWLRNCAKKPAFLRRKLDELRRPIVWCDADCEIIQRPALLEDTSYDLMVYNWHGDPDGNPRHPYNPRRLAASSGVVFLNYTPAALALMDRWVTGCEQRPEWPDDGTLSDLYNTWSGPALRCLWLPKAYNRMDSHWPQVEPVINHVYTNGAIFRTAGQDWASAWFKPR